MKELFSTKALTLFLIGVLCSVGGGSGSVSLSTSANCSWHAVTSENWIAITSADVGIGNATINYTVATNTTGAVRNGAILVGGQTVSVKQKGS